MTLNDLERRFAVVVSAICSMTKRLKILYAVLDSKLALNLSFYMKYGKFDYKISRESHRTETLI